MEKILSLKKIKNKKGNIVKILSSKDKNFKKIKEIYFSHVKLNSIKAWKKHKKNNLNLIVVLGRVKFVFCNGKNKFRSMTVSKNLYKKIYIPAGVWFGFKGLSKKNLIISISSGLSSEKEISRKEVNDIKFNW